MITEGFGRNLRKCNIQSAPPCNSQTSVVYSTGHLKQKCPIKKWSIHHHYQVNC